VKIDLLETHDRLLHFKKDQSANLFEGVNECLTKNKNCVDMQEHFPYVYIFAHPRTAEDGVTKRMLWQPRLMKPKAQTNSFLFRVISKTDIVEIVWMLPPREMWDQYKKGQICENEDVMVSIENFVHHREALEAPHKDDWSEEKIKKKLESIQNPTTLQI
jgi:hypothetical protein